MKISSVKFQATFSIESDRHLFMWMNISEFITTALKLKLSLRVSYSYRQFNY